MIERTVLLVEDNRSDEELTIRALKKNVIGNTLVVTRDGAEAIDYLFGGGAFAGRDVTHIPLLILLDLKLPKLSGLEVLRRLRADERTRRVPVVIWTSSREIEDVLSGYDNGCNSYLCKPVEFAQFSESLRLVASYWLAVNEPPPATPGRPSPEDISGN